jgi:hypothetical protein
MESERDEEIGITENQEEVDTYFDGFTALVTVSRTELYHNIGNLERFIDAKLDGIKEEFLQKMRERVS